MHVIGQQLDRIEEKIVETIFVEKHVSVKIQKPLIDLPSQREKVMFKTSQSKTLEVVEKMLSDLKVKTEGTSKSATCTISRNGKKKKEKKLFLMKIQILILFPLFLLKRFLMMIYQKLKDLLEIPNPCLLQKTCI